MWVEHQLTYTKPITPPCARFSHDLMMQAITNGFRTLEFCKAVADWTLVALKSEAWRELIPCMQEYMNNELCKIATEAMQNMDRV